MPSGFDVAVYEVIGLPPLKAGAVKATDAWLVPGMATPMVGAPGATRGARSASRLAPLKEPHPVLLS